LGPARFSRPATRPTTRWEAGWKTPGQPNAHPSRAARAQARRRIAGRQCLPTFAAQARRGRSEMGAPTTKTRARLASMGHGMGPEDSIKNIIVSSSLRAVAPALMEAAKSPAAHEGWRKDHRAFQNLQPFRAVPPIPYITPRGAHFEFPFTFSMRKPLVWPTWRRRSFFFPRVWHAGWMSRSSPWPRLKKLAKKIPLLIYGSEYLKMYST